MTYRWLGVKKYFNTSIAFFLIFSFVTSPLNDIALADSVSPPKYVACNYDALTAAVNRVVKFEDDNRLNKSDFDYEQSDANQIAGVFGIAGGLGDFCLKLLYTSGISPLTEWGDSFGGVDLGDTAEDNRKIVLTTFATEAFYRYLKDTVEYFDVAINEIAGYFPDTDVSGLKKLSYEMASDQEKQRLGLEGNSQKQSCVCKYMNPVTKVLNNYIASISSSQKCSDFESQLKARIPGVSCVPAVGEANTNLIADEYFKNFIGQADLNNSSAGLSVSPYKQQLAEARQIRSGLAQILQAVNNVLDGKSKVGKLDSLMNSDYSSFMKENNLPYTADVQEASFMMDKQLEEIKNIYKAVLEGNSFNFKNSESLLLFYLARDFDDSQSSSISEKVYNYSQNLLTGVRGPMQLGARQIAADIYSSIDKNYVGTTAQQYVDKLLLVKNIENKVKWPLMIGLAGLTLKYYMAAGIVSLVSDTSTFAFPYLLEDSVNKKIESNYGFLPAAGVRILETGLMFNALNTAKSVAGVSLVNFIGTNSYRRSLINTFGLESLYTEAEKRIAAATITRRLADVNTLINIAKGEAIPAATASKSAGIFALTEANRLKSFSVVDKTGIGNDVYVVNKNLSADLAALNLGNPVVAKAIKSDEFRTGATIVNYFGSGNVIDPANTKVIGGVSGSSLLSFARAGEIRDLDVTLGVIVKAGSKEDAALTLGHAIKAFDDAVREGSMSNILKPGRLSLIGSKVDDSIGVDLSQKSAEDIRDMLLSGKNQYVELGYKTIKGDKPVSVFINSGFNMSPDGVVSSLSGGKWSTPLARGRIPSTVLVFPTSDKNTIFKGLADLRKLGEDLTGVDPFSPNSVTNEVAINYKEAQKFLPDDPIKAIGRVLSGASLEGNNSLAEMASNDYVYGTRVLNMASSPTPPTTLSELKPIKDLFATRFGEPWTPDFVKSGNISDNLGLAILRLETNISTQRQLGRNIAPVDWPVVSDSLRASVSEVAKNLVGSI